jgi:hypothetical protein
MEIKDVEPFRALHVRFSKLPSPCGAGGGGSAVHGGGQTERAEELMKKRGDSGESWVTTVVGGSGDDAMQNCYNLGWRKFWAGRQRNKLPTRKKKILGKN